MLSVPSLQMLRLTSSPRREGLLNPNCLNIRYDIREVMISEMARAATFSPGPLLTEFSV